MNFSGKFAYYQKELEQFKQGEPVSLRRIQLDPVAYCNHDCPFCIFRYDRDEDLNALFNVKDVLSFEKMIEIFDDCVELGVKAVEITGGGEPTLHPQFPEILQALNERDLQIGLITNGAWRDKHYDAIVDGLKDAVWVRFSIDAATPETHIKTHKARAGDFERALRAMQSLVIHTSADVGYSFIVQQSNFHEIRDAILISQFIGVKYIRFGGVFFEGERIDDIELTDIQHAEIAKDIKDIKEHPWSVDILENFDSRSRVEFERYNEGDTCYYSYLGTAIGADAKVYPCCVWKYRPDGVICDLNEVGFAEAWENGALSEFYKEFDISEKCNRCYLKDKNDTIHNYITTDHINFV